MEHERWLKPTDEGDRASGLLSRLPLRTPLSYSLGGLLERRLPEITRSGEIRAVSIKRTAREQTRFVGPSLRKTPVRLERVAMQWYGRRDPVVTESRRIQSRRRITGIRRNDVFRLMEQLLIAQEIVSECRRAVNEAPLPLSRRTVLRS